MMLQLPHCSMYFSYIKYQFMPLGRNNVFNEVVS